MPDPRPLSNGFLWGIFSAVLVFFVISWVQQNQIAKQELEFKKETERRFAEIQEQLKKLPEVPKEKIDFPEFYAATSEYKRVDLAKKDSESFVQKKQTGETEVVGRITKKIYTSGTIGNGYLVVKASVNGGGLTSNDDIFAILYNEGGHLISDQSLPTPETIPTILLYKLEKIPYFTSLTDRTPKDGNWLLQLNAGDGLAFQSFLSSNRGKGVINEIFIAYECAEDSADCLIEAR